MASTQEPLRAVVGCGRAGENHASGYRGAANAELVGVYDLDRVAGFPVHDTMGLESSAGVPLHHSGAFYGTLVASDTEPREFTDAETKRVRAAARLVETAL